MRLALDTQWAWKDNYQVYDARKVWRQLLRKGIVVASCKIERLIILVQNILEQTLWIRKAVTGLIHHSDRNNQYFSVRYNNRLSQSNIGVSVGNTGDFRQCYGRGDHQWLVQDRSHMKSSSNALAKE